ncbi:Hypothetical_protein [Hexamita inflata]|uniref:Hypothetical_protein n=1 Tax=Hexamita inflata TaxID=28002 RepID=A0ABP1GG75_9EUKA
MYLWDSVELSQNRNRNYEKLQACVKLTQLIIVSSNQQVKLSAFPYLVICYVLRMCVLCHIAVCYVQGSLFCSICSKSSFYCRSNCMQDEKTPATAVEILQFSRSLQND